MHGTMRNVPVMTFPDVPPWGTLTQSAWRPMFARTAVAPPSY